MLLWIAIMFMLWEHIGFTNIFLVKQNITHSRTYIASQLPSLHIMDQKCVSGILLLQHIASSTQTDNLYGNSLSCLQAQPRGVMQSICSTSISSSCSRPSSSHGNAVCLLQPKSSTGPAAATHIFTTTAQNSGLHCVFNSLSVSSSQAFRQIERAWNTSRTTFVNTIARDS